MKNKFLYREIAAGVSLVTGVGLLVLVGCSSGESDTTKEITSVTQAKETTSMTQSTSSGPGTRANPIPATAVPSEDEDVSNSIARYVAMQGCTDKIEGQVGKRRIPTPAEDPSAEWGPLSGQTVLVFNEVKDGTEEKTPKGWLVDMVVSSNGELRGVTCSAEKEYNGVSFNIIEEYALK